jgi:hypothetical protein
VILPDPELFREVELWGGAEALAVFTPFLEATRFQSADREASQRPAQRWG